ncbi:hypothetical protein LTS15_003363 [Exophiala xenobiotica]|nr:hypothetical protein LTS15_003363 [Exophiala xenobiotica]
MAISPSGNIGSEKATCSATNLHHQYISGTIDVVDATPPQNTPVELRPDHPFNWTTRRKVKVTALALLTTFTTLPNGTAIVVAHEALSQEWGISDGHFPNSVWPVTSWTLGGAVSSLFVLPIMEDFGVRPWFLSTHFLFLCFIIPQALAENFATLLVCRFFAGGCVSILANTAASVIGNIWEGDRARTVPLSLFMTTFLAGSSAGPILGAAILQNLTWRWISYIQLIVLGAIFPLYYFFFDECRGSVINASRVRNASRERNPAGFGLTIDSSTPAILRRKLLASVRRPLHMLFTEPVVFVFTLWSSFVVGTVYMLTQSVEQVFHTLYDFNSSQGGYMQAAVILGEAIGLVTVLFARPIYWASASRNKQIPGAPIPESRLYLSLIGSFCGLTGGMFVYGWTAWPSMPWVAPAIGLVMVGFGMDLIIIAITDYTIDAYNAYAGSCVAAVVLGENLSASFLPLAVQGMYRSLGLQWASTPQSEKPIHEEREHPEIGRTDRLLPIDADNANPWSIRVDQSLMGTMLE